VSLRHGLLEDAGILHGFGTRESSEPEAVLRPRQVHGVTVASVAAGKVQPGEADAIWTAEPGVAVGVITADCVPVLVAERDGSLVAAIHAGWRGLAAGVIAAALAVLRERRAVADRLVAVVGPCIGRCCYEVDQPVLAALRPRFRSALDGALVPTRPGHARVDLAALAIAELSRTLPSASVGRLTEACTQCDPVRFHSYRRDGPRSGRLLHWVTSPTRSPSGE